MNLREWTEMKTSFRSLVLPFVFPALLGGTAVMNCHAQADTEIGGQKLITISRAVSSTTRPPSVRRKASHEIWR